MSTPLLRPVPFLAIFLLGLCLWSIERTKSFDIFFRSCFLHFLFRYLATYRYAFGCFTCELRFPSDYPINPPVMTFTNKLWHPNVYPDGKVCISILHKDDDPTGYEKRSERWTPVLSIGKVLLSVMSMLAQPNDESPANVDAVSMFLSTRTSR